jgi:hypothetical protein
MAVSGGRARAEYTGRSDADAQELIAAGPGPASALASRRDGRIDSRSDLRSHRSHSGLAPFTIPVVAVALAVPRSVAALCEHFLHLPIAIQAPARCSRGPPSG